MKERGEEWEQGWRITAERRWFVKMGKASILLKTVTLSTLIWSIFLSPHRSPVSSFVIQPSETSPAAVTSFISPWPTHGVAVDFVMRINLKVTWQRFGPQQSRRGFPRGCISPLALLLQRWKRLILTMIIPGCSTISSGSVSWCPELKHHGRRICPRLLLTVSCSSTPFIPTNNKNTCVTLRGGNNEIKWVVLFEGTHLCWC